MSTTILRHCDRCKKEIVPKDYNQIWKIQILVTDEPTYTRQGGRHSLNEYMKTDPTRQDWCRPCVDEVQLLGRAYKAGKPDETVQELTFEDRLREIIREEAEYLCSNR